MHGENVDAILITAALGEELQMVDTYSQVMDLSKDRAVKETLGVLVKESRGHAASISDIILDLSTRYSWELEEIDRKVAEQIAKSPDFKLSGETLEWYRRKISGINQDAGEYPLDARELTKEATIFALNMFLGSERTAYSLYRKLSSGAKGESAKVFLAIMEDELRHANMLNRLIWRLKTGKDGEAPDTQTHGDKAFEIFYCTICRKLYQSGIRKCEECGNGQLKSVR